LAGAGQGSTHDHDEKRSRKKEKKDQRAAGHLPPSEIAAICLDAVSDYRSSRRAAARGLLRAASCSSVAYRLLHDPADESGGRFLLTATLHTATRTTSTSPPVSLGSCHAPAKRGARAACPWRGPEKDAVVAALRGLTLEIRRFHDDSEAFASVPHGDFGSAAKMAPAKSGEKATSFAMASSLLSHYVR
jgi:hypothetical protein